MNDSSLLTLQQKKLLSLVSSSLFNIKTDVEIKDDFQEVLKEAEYQTVSILAFQNTDITSLNDDQIAYVKRNLESKMFRAIFISAEHARLHKIMQSENIPYTIIKGYASADYYPDPIMREMGDVDFLVNPEDLGRAGEALEKNGFKLTKKNHECHRVYSNGKVRYEVHFEVAGIPNGKPGEIIREYLKDVVSCSSVKSTGYGEMVFPSLFHHGLIILLHTLHHLTGEGVGLRQICDWACFISRLTEEEFCNLFEDKLKKAGLWYFARVLTAVSVKYLGCPTKNFCNDIKDEVVDNIISDVFEGGNFGQKDPIRAQQSLLVSDHGKDGIDNKSLAGQFFASANKIVYNKWPISKKLKILLPFGWLFFGLRYIIRSLFGKRDKIKPFSAKNTAVKRREILKDLHLFEIKENGDKYV